MKALLAILLMISLVAPAQASQEILQDVQVSGVRVQLWRSFAIPNSFFAACRGRRFWDYIYVSGEINSDTSFIIGNMLKEISQTMPCSPRRETPPPLILLNSNGGSVYDGFKIGEMLRWYRAQVRVYGVDQIPYMDSPHVCASSCAIAFLGATQRVNEGHLVFHAPYQYVGNTSQINCKNSKVNADLKKYYRRMIGKENGDRLYDRTMRYCSTDDGWVVNKDAAVMYGIANTVLSGG